MRAISSTRLHGSIARSIKCRSAPTPRPYEHVDPAALLRKAIVEANNICHSETEDFHEFECMVAWDTVHEIARGIANREERDPLEEYCAENQDADECRVYDI